MVQFGYSQGNEEIFVTFQDNEKSIQSLIDDGLLDEDIKETHGYQAMMEGYDGEDLDYDNAVTDAVVDWFEYQGDLRDEEDDHEDPFHDEMNDVIRAEYIMDDNLMFNEFLSYRTGGFPY